MNQAQSRIIASILDETVESINEEISMVDGQYNDDDIESIKSISNLIAELNELTLKQNKLTAKEEEDAISARNILIDKTVKDENELNQLKQEVEVKKSKREREAALRRGNLNEWEEKRAKTMGAYESMIAEINKKSQEANDNATRSHERKMNELGKEKDTFHNELSGLQKSHRNLEEELRRKIVNFEREKEKNRIESKSNVQAQLQKIDEVLTSLEDERKQKAQLERHFEKVDTDIKSKKEEEKLLARVIQREAKADEILNDAAITMQKIVRSKLLRLAKNTKSSVKRPKGKRKKK